LLFLFAQHGDDDMADYLPGIRVLSQEEMQEVVREVILDENIPEIHFNGFVNVLTSGDILIILQRNGKNVAKLSASYTIAKTLSQKLMQIITDLEQRSGNTIMTSDQVIIAPES